MTVERRESTSDRRSEGAVGVCERRQDADGLDTLVR
jgi:hypothetical protein